MNRRRFIPLILVVIILSAAFTACNPFNSGNSQNDQQIKVQPADLVIQVNGSGKIGVDNDANLNFGVAGKVASVSVKERDTVKKGAVLAKLETDNLELALSQAQVGLAQSVVSVTQAQVAATQAESAVQTSQLVLDKTKDIGDIKDEIQKIQWDIEISLMNLQAAQDSNFNDSSSYWRQQVALHQLRLAQQQKKLADLLANRDYAGIITYDIAGQKYDRVTLEDIRNKQLQLQAAQQSVEQTKQTIEQARKAQEQAQKAVQVAQKNLNDSTIIAPFEGTVANLKIKAGDVVPGPGLTAQTAVYLIDLSSIEIAAQIDEIDIASVKVGQRVIVGLDSLPDMKIDGKVNSIAAVPVANPGNTGVVVYEVKISFVGKPPEAVKVGMSTTVDIVTSERKGVLQVPVRAISQDNQGKYVVNILVNNKPEPRQVTLGLTDGIQTEITSGLQEGDIVLVKRTGTSGISGQ